MAIYRLANRAPASALFFTNLLRLNPAPPMVAPLAAGVTRMKYLELSEITKHAFIRRGASPCFSFTAAASPFAGRYRSLSSSAAPDDHTCSPSSSRGKLLQSSSMEMMKHPLLAEGLVMMLNVDEYEVEAIVRVDMPGISKEGLKLEIKNNAIHIEGKQEKEPEDEEDVIARTYSGIIDLPPGFYNTDQIKASMKFGVLKIVIPKLRPEEMKDSSLIPPRIEFRGPWLPWN